MRLRKNVKDIRFMIGVKVRKLRLMNLKSFYPMELRRVKENENHNKEES